MQGDGSSDEESAAKKASRGPTPAKKPRENKENAPAADKSDKANPAVSTTTPSRAPLTTTAKTPLNATTTSTPVAVVRRNTMANVRICILCKGEGKKGGFNNGKAIDFKNKFMVKKKIKVVFIFVLPVLTKNKYESSLCCANLTGYLGLQ